MEKEKLKNFLNVLYRISSFSPFDFADDLTEGFINLVASKYFNANTDDKVNSTTLDDSVLSRYLEEYMKVVKELALCRRIDISEKVSIKEFYDTKGEGKAGIQASSTGINMGLSGSGERVTKRIYIFEGWREGGLQGFDQEIFNLVKDQISDLLKEHVVVEEDMERKE